MQGSMPYKKETQSHIYKCMQLSENKLHKRNLNSEKFMEKNVSMMKEILTILKENMNKRDKQTNK